MRTVENNIALFKWYQFVFNFAPMATLLIVYFQQITGSYAVATAVWSVCMVVRTIMEIPSGLISDKIGRRNTLILVCSTTNLCFFLWALAGQLHMSGLLFIGAVSWGISGSLLSGTIEALIYETTLQTGKESEFKSIYAQSQIWAQCGLAISALFASVISRYFSLQTLAWITAFLGFAPIIIVFHFSEPKHYTPYSKLSPLQDFILALRLVRRKRKLRFYAIITLLNFAVEKSVHRFEAAYFKMLISDALINLVRSLKQFFGMIGFYIASKLRKYTSPIVYFSAFGFNSFFRFFALAINNFCTPFLMSFVNLFYGLTMTASTDILQKEFSKRQRVTTQSIISFFSGFAEAGILYLFGLIADLLSPRWAMFLAVLVNVLLLSFSQIKLYKKEYLHEK